MLRPLILHPIEVPAVSCKNNLFFAQETRNVVTVPGLHIYTVYGTFYRDSLRVAMRTSLGCYRRTSLIRTLPHS